MGTALIGVNEFEHALEKFNSSYEIAKKTKDKDLQAGILHNIGAVHWNLGNYQSAHRYYLQSLEIYREISDKKMISRILGNIGIVHREMGNYEQALENFLKSSEMIDKNSDEKGYANSVNNIGIIYYEQKKYEQAAKYFMKSARKYEKYGDKMGSATPLNNVATCYNFLGKYTKAMEYFQRSARIYEEIGFKKGSATTFNNLANCFFKLKNLEKALKFARKSKKLSLEIGFKSGLMYSLFNIGEITFRKKNYQRALFYLKQSLKIANETDSKVMIKKCFEKISDIYFAMEDHKNALKFHKKYSTLKDEIFNKENSDKIAEMQTKYETEKKEKEAEIYRLNNIELTNKNKLITKQKEQIQKAEKKLRELNKNLEKRVIDEVAKRREQEQKAIEQSRLAALGELASGIAHEINQPLHNILFTINNMNLAIKKKRANEDYLSKKIDFINEDVSRMKKIIDHIRLFSRNQIESRQEEFCINESIKNAVDMINEQYSRNNIRIDLNLDEKIGKVLGNIYKYEQVVFNLISNSRDALIEKSKMNRKDFVPNILIKSYQKNNEIIMEFRDNGNGISSENLEKLFIPFFTTKDPGKGTGLGLSISYGIIKEMEGEIKIQSRLSHGAVVTVSLPDR